MNYDTIELVDGDSILATHPRLTGKRQYSLNIAHYVKTFHRKPGAIRNAKVLAQVDTQLKDLFECYYRNNPREFLPILDLIRESSVEALSAAITMMNEGGDTHYSGYPAVLHSSTIVPDDRTLASPSRNSSQ